MSDSYRVIPLTPVRKLIGARMTHAYQTIPHFRLGVDVEIDMLRSRRRALREGNPGVELSLNDLFIKACAMALMENPAINLQWMDGDVHQYPNADISVVAQLADGTLSTPIIRSADLKSIWEIAQEVRELLELGANRALKTHQIVGGTFSISNLGMYGIDEFDAIINAPQCAILAIGAAKTRMMPSEQGEMRIASVLRATLSVDHRAVDGATGAAFLSAFRKHVQEPDYEFGADRTHAAGTL